MGRWWLMARIWHPNWPFYFSQKGHHCFSWPWQTAAEKRVVRKQLSLVDDFHVVWSLDVSLLRQRWSWTLPWKTRRNEGARARHWPNLQVLEDVYPRIGQLMILGWKGQFTGNMLQISTPERSAGAQKTSAEPMILRARGISAFLVTCRGNQRHTGYLRSLQLFLHWSCGFASGLQFKPWIRTIL